MRAKRRRQRTRRRRASLLGDIRRGYRRRRRARTRRPNAPQAPGWTNAARGYTRFGETIP